MRQLLVFVALVALAWPARADVISSFAEGNVNGASATDSDTTSTFNDPIAAAVSLPGGFFTNTTASAVQNITVLGAKGVVAVDGVFATGTPGLDTLLARNELVSTAATDGDYQFSLFITGGQLRVADFAGVSAFDPFAPQVTYDILVELHSGGTTSTLFHSAATLRGGQSGHTLTETGTDLGGTFAGSGAVFGYDFGGFLTLFDLGTLSAGDFVSYSMSVSLTAGRFELGGSAFFGDPNDLDGTGSGGLLTRVGDAPGGPGNVPEPGTLMLLGAALAVGLVARRRR